MSVSVRVCECVWGAGSGEVRITYVSETGNGGIGQKKIFHSNTDGVGPVSS